MSAEGRQKLGGSNLYVEGTPPIDKILLTRTGLAVMKTITFGPEIVMDPSPFLDAFSNNIH
jgi:hypothetical protein